MQYYLFIDESGDPSLSSINQNFPIFVLLGCLFTEEEYSKMSHKIDTLKVEIFGSKDVILHSRDIRKCEGVFVKLFDLKEKEIFYNRINTILGESTFTIVSVVIHQKRIY